MDIIPISRKHGASKEFFKRFCEAIFVFDSADKRKVEETLISMGKNWDDIWKFDSDWILARVRRLVPAPEIIYPAVKKLFVNFHNLKCSRTDVGSKIRYKTIHRGHYNPWLTQRINHLMATLEMKTHGSYHDPTCDAIHYCGNPTNEEFGVISLSDNLLKEYSMSRPEGHVQRQISTYFEDVTNLCVPISRASKSQISAMDLHPDNRIKLNVGPSEDFLPLNNYMNSNHIQENVNTSHAIEINHSPSQYHQQALAEPHNSYQSHR
ncbi:hypothetical protein HPULCUR_012081 [Helicostylum pulchrum]|uniref:Uncharacterized protein n=1 Tax=Helicostylum pulchrum TaxID=562976 RepID=A0ABP9YI80_9FUNG